MNQQIEEDVEVVASSQSDQRSNRKFDSNIPELSGKDAVRFEGSSHPDTKRKWRYTSKDVKRYANLAKGALLPLTLDPETLPLTLVGHLAIDKGAKVLGKKLDAHNAAVDAAKAANASHAPEVGHIAPHITGPEPAILPPIPSVKPPVPLRPIGK